jgi:hypothetical protein
VTVKKPKKLNLIRIGALCEEHGYKLAYGEDKEYTSHYIKCGLLFMYSPSLRLRVIRDANTVHFGVNKWFDRWVSSVDYVYTLTTEESIVEAITLAKLEYDKHNYNPKWGKEYNLN